MGLYDHVFETNWRLRVLALHFRLKDPQAQAQVFKAWREFAVLTATDFFDKSLSEQSLDDAVSDVLLDIMIGPDPQEAQCSADDLVHVMTHDAKLHQYVKRRLSTGELLYVIKRAPGLPHRELLQEALDGMPELPTLTRAA